MGKLILITFSLLFSLSLQAKGDATTNPKKDPNLKIGKLQVLNGKLPKLNVTSGVCTSPTGCQEEKLVQASLNVEAPFEKQKSEAGQKSGSGGSSSTDK